MKSFVCPECGKKMYFTNEDILCTKCRRELGLPPYDFISVDITPFFNDDYKGFVISWVAKGYGSSSTEFWKVGDQWVMENEPYPKDFLDEAMKFFFKNVEVEE